MNIQMALAIWHSRDRRAFANIDSQDKEESLSSSISIGTGNKQNSANADALQKLVQQAVSNELKRAGLSGDQEDRNSSESAKNDDDVGRDSQCSAQNLSTIPKSQ